MQTDKGKPMDRPELISMLRMAHDEIVVLRRTIERLEPKANAYDTIAQFARLSIHPENQGYGEDVAWRLKQAVEELIKERDAENAK